MTRYYLALLVTAFTSTACTPPPIQQTAAEGNIRQELWVEPPSSRDLFYGVGGRDLAPRRDVLYEIEKRDPSGFSTTLDLKDPSGREWSAKLGAEAQAEVVSSRIAWGIGYHQPPSYFVATFKAKEGRDELQEQQARLRPKVSWIDSRETWSWHQNPFVDTQAYRGLLVLMMVLNSTDLKDDNNNTYLVRQRGRAPVLWYTVKDLGASLGATGRFYPERNDIDEFEKRGFIERVEGQTVRFAFDGRHQELLKPLTVDDVQWTCRRLARLSDRQWEQAFSAGGYPEDVRRRYIAKIKAKIAEGLALRGGGGVR